MILLHGFSGSTFYKTFIVFPSEKHLILLKAAHDSVSTLSYFPTTAIRQPTHKVRMHTTITAHSGLHNDAALRPSNQDCIDSEVYVVAQSNL